VAVVEADLSRDQGRAASQIYVDRVSTGVAGERRGAGLLVATQASGTVVVFETFDARSAIADRTLHGAGGSVRAARLTEPERCARLSAAVCAREALRAAIEGAARRARGAVGVHR